MCSSDLLIDLEDALNKDYIYSNDAINFCIELPNVDLFGGICFQRLFNTQLAHLLGSEYLQKPILVDGDDIMVEIGDGKYGKCSVSITGVKNGAALIHTGINISAGPKAPDFAYSTNLTDEQAEKFMKDACEMFYGMRHDIFVAETKVII